MATKSTTPTEKTQDTYVSQLTWLPKKTFELEITIPWEDVKKTYEHILDHLVEDTTIKGFRKGKGPRNMVETQVGKENIYGEVVQHVVSDAYVKAVNHHNLRPIVNPMITPVNLKEGENWVVKATSCEAPEVKLGNYKDAIKGLKAKKSLWTPDKGEKVEKEDPTSSQPTLDEIFEEVLKTTEVEIADMLIETESSRMLSQLVDQANAVGITIQQYLEGRNLTQEQLKAQYRESAEKTLKLEFILAEMASENHIEVKDSEIDEMVNKTADENTRKALQSPEQRNYLALILRKQKTIDFLKSL